LLAPLDREFKEVLKTINMPSILYIALLEKPLIERVKKFKMTINSALKTQKTIDGGG